MSTAAGRRFTDRNVALAKACGLEIERLESFTLEVKPNEPPTVHATYALPEADELAPLLRLFTLVEDIAHIEVKRPKQSPTGSPP